MFNHQKDHYLRFMSSSKISSDHLKFLRNLELFLIRKLNFEEVTFFSLGIEKNKQFPRRIITSPKHQTKKISLPKDLLKHLKRKTYYFEKNKFWLVLGEDKTRIYLAEARPSLKTDLEEKTLPIFLKFVQNHLESIFGFQKELSLLDKDDVTGLYNQRRLHKDLIVEKKKYETTKTPFSVLFIDIDHFKSVNDGSGHLVGSQLLSDLADRLKDVLRGSDNFYRYGGDEFVIILPGASTHDGLKIGKRILKKIKEKPFRINDLKDSFFLSVSIGLATFPTHIKDIKGLLELADNMLYRAKELGRGRVCSVSEIFKKKK